MNNGSMACEAKVYCAICGEERCYLNQFHLGMHNMTTAEYKILFPNHKTRCIRLDHVNLGHKHNLETKQKMRLAKLGVPQSLESRKAKSVATLGKPKTQITKDRMSATWKKLFADSNYSLRKIRAEYMLGNTLTLGYHHTEETKKLMASYWTEGPNKEAKIKKILDASGLHPNKMEKKVNDILAQLNLSFVYCGDFSVFMGGKNPDFLDKKNQRIIEFFGTYWHSPEDELVRINHFAKHGYKTLVIWDREMRNIKTLLDRILAFVEGE